MSLPCGVTLRARRLRCKTDRKVREQRLPFLARASFRGKRISLGCYSSAAEAHRAYLDFRTTWPDGRFRGALAEWKDQHGL